MHKVILISMLFFAIGLKAQTVETDITFHLKDSESEQTLIGAEVFMYLDSNFIGRVADLDGKCTFENIPVGRHDFYFRSLGYELQALKNHQLISGQSAEVIIRLKPSINQIEDVVIKAKKDKAGSVNTSTLVSSRTFSVEETSRYAGSFNDPARMAQSFAGVSNSNDENNEIIIRGNSPRGVQWRMEGLEIPNPNHYSEGEGSSGGAIAMLSNTVLANSDFLTGAFPSEYGNALSGVFDVQLRNGTTKKRTTSIQVGALGLQLGSEGPLSKKGNSSYLVNYRYSTVTILESIGLEFTDENEKTPTFQDLSFKLRFKDKKGGSFSIYGLGGQSIAGTKEVKSQEDLQMFGNDYYDEKYRLGVVGMNKTILLPKSNSSLKLSASYNLELNTYDDGYIDQALNTQLTDNEKFQYGTLRTSAVYKNKLNNKNTIQVGLLGNRLGFDLTEREVQNGDWVTYLNDDGSAWHIQSYAQWIHRFSVDTRINVGMHQTYFALNKQSITEPRFSIQHRLSNKLSLNAGLGMHSRLEPISFYLAKGTDENGQPVQRNKNVELTKAFHSVLGASYKINDDWRVKLDGYYQTLHDVPELTIDGITFSSLNFSSGFTNLQLVNSGKGRNYGIELTLEKFLTNGTFLLLTTSIFQSEFKQNEQWLSTRYNNNIVTNLLYGKEWKVGKTKSNWINLNGRIMMRGGQRVQPIDIEASKANGRTVYVRDNGYSDQLKTFFRSDISFKYQKNKAKKSWSLGFDLQNALNTENIQYEYYSTNRDQIIGVTQLGLLPVINYTVVF